MKSIRPVLRVTDMDAALAFYTEGLGFKVGVHAENRAWVELARADVTLALYDAAVFSMPSAPSLIVVFVADVDEIWAELRRRGTDVTAVETHADGRYRDFQTEDPSGNVIVVSEAL